MGNLIYNQCWGSYFECIALQAINYFTLEEKLLWGEI